MFWYLRGMDVYLTDLRGPSEHATHQGRQAADLDEHASTRAGGQPAWPTTLPTWARGSRYLARGRCCRSFAQKL